MEKLLQASPASAISSPMYRKKHVKLMLVTL